MGTRSGRLAADRNRGQTPIPGRRVARPCGDRFFGATAVPVTRPGEGCGGRQRVAGSTPVVQGREAVEQEGCYRSKRMPALSQRMSWRSAWGWPGSASSR